MNEKLNQIKNELKNKLTNEEIENMTYDEISDYILTELIKEYDLSPKEHNLNIVHDKQLSLFPLLKRNNYVNFTVRRVEEPDLTSKINNIFNYAINKVEETIVLPNNEIEEMLLELYNEVSLYIKETNSENIQLFIKSEINDSGINESGRPTNESILEFQLYYEIIIRLLNMFDNVYLDKGSNSEATNNLYLSLYNFLQAHENISFNKDYYVNDEFTLGKIK